MFSNSRRLTDSILKCPFDNHLIAKSRIQLHIVKCEKRFAKNYKVMCPYDATHRIFSHELGEHILMCPLRTALLSEIFSSETKGHGSLNFDLRSDFSGMTDANDECLVHDGPFVSEEETAETNDAAMNVQKDDSELALEEVDCDFEPLQLPWGYPKATLIEEQGGSVIEDDRSIISSIGLGRGVICLRDSETLKRPGIGRGKLLINSNLKDCNVTNQKLP